MSKGAFRYLLTLAVFILIIVLCIICTKRDNNVNAVNSVYVDTITYKRVIDSIDIQIRYKDSIVKQIKIDMTNESEKVMLDNADDAYKLFIELSQGK